MKKIIKITIIIIIFTMLIIIGWDFYKEKSITTKDWSSDSNEAQEISKVSTQKDVVMWSQEEDGYDIIAKLEIPKIDLQTNVLSRYNENTMLVSVTKFWGPEPNEIGNFCIIGHNYYKRKNMFYNLKNLSKGDEILLTDRTNNTISYEVYSIIKIKPKDISCLSQETDGKREITLITCTNDSQKRIVVKARQISE